MTTSNMEARREAFDAWANQPGLCGIHRQFAWEVWNAAIDSICVELPESVSGGAAFPYKCYEGGWNDALAEVQEALTTSGVPYK